jgi:hypothetical protein
MEGGARGAAAGQVLGGSPLEAGCGGSGHLVGEVAGYDSDETRRNRIAEDNGPTGP